MSFECLRALVAVAAFIAVSPAFAAPCLPAAHPPANHPSLQALPDSYWRALPDWADMAAGDRDLLARVSIVQRDIRAADRKLHFSAEVPSNVMALKTAPDQQFVADGAARLDALVLAARAYLSRGVAGTSIYVSNGFRSYAVQRATWPRNLRKYLDRMEADLRAFRRSDGAPTPRATTPFPAIAAINPAVPPTSTRRWRTRRS